MYKFKISEGFWSDYQKLINDVVVPFQKRILGDEIEGIEKSHALENFRIAAGESNEEFYGWVFQDSDVAKWLEAASYSLSNFYDKDLDKEIDDVIELVGKAQQDDGYLDTYFTVKHPERRFEDLQEAHELYCFGHMIEAGVAHFESTGKTSLLNIVKKSADLLCNTFGKDKRRGYPGHPEIELALMRLYDVTKEQKYLDLAKYFVDERGTEPNYFKEEKSARDWNLFDLNPDDTLYPQNYAPVREQKDAVGHAVRAVYLYTGMAGVAKATNDPTLIEACENLWKSITERKMYVTGGIGAACSGEAFSLDYDLPNDSVYAETCAAIGLIFFAYKMLSINVDSKYSNVMERALYNGMLAGMSLDGKNFFYTNPLEVNPKYTGKTAIRNHIHATRPSWFGCACCPPNIARLISSLNKYSWSVCDNTIYSHLFIGGELDLSEEMGFKLNVKTKYPHDGVVGYTFNTNGKKISTVIAIRIPDWSIDNYKIELNGKDVEYTIKNGYAYIKKEFSDNDTITLTLDMSPKKIYSNLKISNNSECVSISRGPIVYCFEGVDNDNDLLSLRISKNSVINTENFNKDLLGGIIPLTMDGIKLSSDNSLYSFNPPKEEPYKLTAVPYYVWGNRGENEMRVWIPER